MSPLPTLPEALSLHLRPYPPSTSPVIWPDAGHLTLIWPPLPSHTALRGAFRPFQCSPSTWLSAPMRPCCGLTPVPRAAQKQDILLQTLSSTALCPPGWRCDQWAALSVSYGIKAPSGPSPLQGCQQGLPTHHTSVLTMALIAWRRGGGGRSASLRAGWEQPLWALHSTLCGVHCAQPHL